MFEFKERNVQIRIQYVSFYEFSNDIIKLEQQG